MLIGQGHCLTSRRSACQPTDKTENVLAAIRHIFDAKSQRAQSPQRVDKKQNLHLCGLAVFAVFAFM
jgi:hypothetical protein